MSREPLYPVKKEAFLFPAQSLREGNQGQPEEEVRQWCAYELMRAYGVRVGELEFERPVRVGSKTYRIDILVSRRGLPWVVVECKEPGHTRPAEGMGQAISYADAQGVRATFAVYTNGHVWQVKRRVRDQWLVVPDLPARAHDDGAGVPLTEVLRALHGAAPLLHKLHEPLADAGAAKFLGALQGFFCGNHLLTEGTDRDLRFGVDNLLRVLAAATNHPNYRLGKLATARDAFGAYRERIGSEVEPPPVYGEISLAENCRQLRAFLLSLAEGSQGMGTLDGLLLRLAVALADYGSHQKLPRKPHPVLPPQLHRALGEFVEATMAINLNTQLPDELDGVRFGDMKRYCQPGWEHWDDS